MRDLRTKVLNGQFCVEIAVETPRQIRRRVEEGRAHDTIPVPLGLISVLSHSVFYAVASAWRLRLDGIDPRKATADDLSTAKVQLTERKFHRALRRYDDVRIELCEAEAERLRARHATTRKRR